MTARLLPRRLRFRLACMDLRPDLDDWLFLLRTPTLGAVALRALLARHGSASAACAALRRPGCALAAPARAWIESPDRARLAADRVWLQQPGHRLLCCDEADFPPQLQAGAGAPIALFVAGDATLLLRPQVAVVGARAATPAGLALASRFAAALAAAGLTVGSGLAEGVDAAAHRAALDRTGGTLAVVGTGADRVYPRHHRELAAAIAARGAVVSPFPPGSPPLAAHFPQRNRVLAGLALGVLVIEAGIRSGALITARAAVDLDREVFALPGAIGNPLARGCHALIREGATLVEDPAEVIAAMVPAARTLGAELRSRLDAEPAPATPGIADAAATAALLDALGHVPAALDELCARTGAGSAALAAELALLELDGRVAQLAGGRWQRVG